jgi:hypothetical protein
MWVGDPLVDACVEDFERLGRGRSMRQLRRAIKDGIETVPDAPESLRALFADLDAVPEWADLDAIDRGVTHLARYSRQTGIVLGAASLLAGYANATASRPLQMTGRFIENAGMRSLEVGNWLRTVSAVGGLRRHSPGFERTVRVRFIHGFVRHQLRNSPEWDHAAWGLPIPQAHLAYTVDEFCLIPLRALRQVGVSYLPHEVADGFFARWRYIGHLLGVTPSLLPVDRHDQELLEELHLLTRPPMEDFCRDLVGGINREFLVPELEQLLPGRLGAAAPWAVHGLERLFLGEEICDELGVPRSSATGVVRRLGHGLRAVNVVVDRVPGIMARRTAMGERYTDSQELRLRTAYAVRHDMVDDSPDTGRAHPARVGTY